MSVEHRGSAPGRRRRRQLDLSALRCSWLLLSAPAWLLLLGGLGAAAAHAAASHGQQRHAAAARAVGLALLGWPLLALCLRLDGAIASWAPLLAPPLAGAAVYFCCCCCVCGVLTAAPQPRGRDVPPPDHIPVRAAQRQQPDREPLLPRYGSEGLGVEV